MPEYNDVITNNPEVAEDSWKSVKDWIDGIGKGGILKNPLVLDLGGGTGEFSQYLNSQGIKCVSLEKRDYDLKAGAKQVKADAYTMPFANESFDILYARGFFDPYLYWHNYKLLVQEIARVLKTGGLLVGNDKDQPPDEELNQYFRRITNDMPIWEKK